MTDDIGFTRHVLKTLSGLREPQQATPSEAPTFSYLSTEECIRRGIAVNAAPVPTQSESDTRIRELEAVLEDCLEYLTDHVGVDVIDGDYGQPEPDRTMLLAQSIEFALGRRPAP